VVERMVVELALIMVVDEGTTKKEIEEREIA
jgi:hypothetical protein